MENVNSRKVRPEGRTNISGSSSELRQAIAEGKYKEGQRIPSETQLSRTCGASRLTVARALKELETLGIIERRPGSGSYVRQQVPTQGRTFGLLIPELGQTEIFEPICQGMARASRTSQDELLWGAASHDAESHEQQAFNFRNITYLKMFRGCFLRRWSIRRSRLEVNRRILEDFQKTGIPVVLLDRDVGPYPHRSHCDLVGIDNRRVGLSGDAAFVSARLRAGDVFWLAEFRGDGGPADCGLSGGGSAGGEARDGGDWRCRIARIDCEAADETPAGRFCLRERPDSRADYGAVE